MAASERVITSTGVRQVSSDRSSALPSAASDDRERIIAHIAPEERGRMLGSKSFSFKHDLGEHPSLTLPAVRQLVAQMFAEGRFDQIFYKTGKSMASGRYSDADSTDEILTVLDNFDNAGVWLRLTRVDEVTPQFDELVDRFYAELSELYQQDIKARTMRTFLALFVSSPGAYTNYHIDHTWNFLLQISGRKTVHLYDPLDPDVITQGDKEGWYMRNFTLTPKAQAKAIAYELGPGDGVHHPVNAPHWVQNGSEISISLSIGLCLHDSNRDAKIHQTNFVLRRFGLKPKPPGRSKWRDAAKVSFMSLWSEKSSTSLDKAVFSGATRLRRMLNIRSADNSYEPK